MEYIVYGSVITNRLIYTDGTRIEDVMGGGGFYSLAGLRMCTPSVLFVSAVGPDFEDYYGEWFDRNSCSKDGLIRNMDKTIYWELVYAPDGTYVEYSIYGPEQNEKDWKNMALTPGDFPPIGEDTKGVYFNSDITPELGEMLLEAKKRHPFQVMWELPASQIPKLAEIYAKDGMEGLRRRLKAVDVLSTNRPESFEIFGVSTVEEAIQRFQELGLPCYYRVGTKGAYMLDKGEVAYVPMLSLVSREEEIDPTGCGNSSTAAAMWAYCEGFDPLKTCIVGNVVAAYNVQQYGPYPDMRQHTFQEMMGHVERIYNSMK
ncbi:MAG: carbohydrate kinase family protein [Oscillospiraceae bacterium]|nr:carbohydrate kinase family protein [Oscillospiraceae bacterium]